MGRKNNIKSARKLIDAKRKREQEASIAAGLGPAGIALNKRVTLNGGIIIPNQGIKYSKLLEDFISPMLSANDDISSIKIKCTIAVWVWNAAIMKQKSKESFQLAKKELTSLMPEVPEIGELFDDMAKRKEDEFSDYNNIIVDFEIKKNRGGDFDLTVATSPFDSQR